MKDDTREDLSMLAILVFMLGFVVTLVAFLVGASEGFVRAFGYITITSLVISFQLSH